MFDFYIINEYSVLIEFRNPSSSGTHLFWLFSSLLRFAVAPKISKIRKPKSTTARAPVPMPLTSFAALRCEICIEEAQGDRIGCRLFEEEAEEEGEEEEAPMPMRCDAMNSKQTRTMSMRGLIKQSVVIRNINRYIYS